MTNQLTPHDLGESNQHWYEFFPERLEEEIRLMKEAHPSFIFHKEDGKNVFWTGNAKFSGPDGSVLYNLEIKVECGRDYPKIFPLVYDPSGILKSKKCPHLNHSSESYTLCYGNRLDPQLDFFGTARIKNVVDYVCIFLARQWCYEKYGEWPGGQPHGILPFLEYEVKTATIDPDEVCPCGLNTKKYRECHLPLVKSLLYGFDPDLSNKIWRKARKIKLNEKCPCGSDRKYKKCCQPKINYPTSKTFLLLKFPNFFEMSNQDRDRFLTIIIQGGEKSTQPPPLPL